MKKKSAVPDDLLYKGFTMACPYRTNGKKIKPINAPVRCKNDSKGWTSHCNSCGWNPAVTQQRLEKMVGKMKALKLMAQSDELAKKTKEEINKGAYPYVL